VRIYNNHRVLTAKEKNLLKKAKSFRYRTKPKKVIVTDNGQWWECNFMDGARQFLINNGCEEIQYKKNS